MVLSVTDINEVISDDVNVNECDEDSDGNIYEYDESDFMMVLIMMIIGLKTIYKTVQDDIIFSVVVYQILYFALSNNLRLSKLGKT